MGENGWKTRNEEHVESKERHYATAWKHTTISQTMNTLAK